VKDTEQSIAPFNRRARGVDVMVPVTVRISIALASSLWRGVADEFPKRGQKLAGCGNTTFTRGNIVPPS
jgi:hypothetical protein